LGRLESDFDGIVLLGDIWETLTSERPYDAAAGLKRSREAHPRLARRFETKRYLYVHGNHDIISSHVSGAPAELLIDCDGQRLLFTHGHHHDWLIRRARWLSECGIWIGGWSQRLRLSMVYRLGYNFDAWLSRPTIGTTVDSFQRWALSLARQRDANVVITGHTHVPSRSEHGEAVYLNSGSCSEGAFTYLALDTRAERYAVAA
jgi:predicted phosphodiesterase